MKLVSKPISGGKKILELADVWFYYQKTEALRNVSLCVHEGERIVFLGANGSGKSTLLKILDGLAFASQGKYIAFGDDINKEFFSDEKREYGFRRKVGYVFQDSDVQLFSPTVWDEVAFAPLNMGIEKNEVIKRTKKALEIMGIDYIKDRMPQQLSGGEKKKVALASVLSYGPQLWLFDEPTAGLDPRSQSRLIEFMYRVSAKNNTLITATHDLTILNEIAERVIVLSENHTIVADTTPEEILHNKNFLRKHNLIHEHMHKHKHTMHKHGHIHFFSHE